MRVPKYRKHSSRDIGFSEWQHRRIYFPGRYNSAESKAAYRAFIRDHGLAEPVQRPGNTTTITIATLGALYLDHAERHYPAGTHSEYAAVRIAVGRLLQAHASLPAKEFGPLKLKAFRDSLISPTVARSYVNRQLAKVRRMFAWGVSEELIPAEVYHALMTVPGIEAHRTKAREPEKIKPVAWADVEATLGELHPIHQAMVRFQWLTGARSQSICLAKAKQFDTSATPWIWRPRHKTEYRGTELIVFVGIKAAAIIKPFMENRPYLFDPRDSRNDPRYNDHYDSNSYRQAIERAIERVNEERAEKKLPLIEEWTPHQIRHAHATTVRAKYGLEAAQVALGHESMDITQVYAEKNLELARKIASEIG